MGEGKRGVVGRRRRVKARGLPRLPQGLLVVVALASLPLVLLSTTQPWETQRRLDPAGLAWENDVSGAVLAPLATALLPVAAASVLASLLMRKAWRKLATVLSVASSGAATVLIAVAVPEQRSGWWLVALGASILATVSLLWLFDPRAPAPRRPVQVPLNAHEQQRRSQAATWASLSVGDDPTARPGPRGESAAGTM